MSEYLCPNCGNRNPANSDFCTLCNIYFGWTDFGGPVPTDDRTREIPAQPKLWAEVKQPEVLVVTPGDDKRAVTVHIANTSTVVEAYRVVGVDVPPWLIVTPGQVRLLPGTDEWVQVGLAIGATDLVAVHRFQVTLRVQGESDQRAYRDLMVDATVGPVHAPVQLELEPENIRVEDATAADLRVLVDNRRSNMAKRFELSGSDHEQQVEFEFEPALLEVPPGGEAVARLRVEASLPPAGEEVNRTLTVVAVSGEQEFRANAELIQAASVVDPVELRLDPNVIHAVGRHGECQIVLDNRRGKWTQQIRLEARDAQGAVGIMIAPQELEVGAGQEAMARLTMQAPPPAAGRSVTRQLTVSAWNGRDTVETQGQLVQEAAARHRFPRVLLLGGAGIVLVLLVILFLRLLDPLQTIDRLETPREVTAGGITVTVESVEQRTDSTSVSLFVRNERQEEILLVFLGGATLRDENGQTLYWAGDLEDARWTIPAGAPASGEVVFNGHLPDGRTAAMLSIPVFPFESIVVTGIELRAIE